MTTPSAVKKLRCSATMCSGPPVGWPGSSAAGTPPGTPSVVLLAHTGPSRLPTTNQAPAAAARAAPSIATGRKALIIRISPPRAAANPGTTSRKNRPQVQVHAVSGV